MSSAIRVESLSKRYLLRHQAERGGSHRYVALRDVVTDKVKSLLRSPASALRSPSREEFWALRDVSFEVQQGEAVGIIGRNGAGKSTLLKLLSRITKPTKGRIEIEGRVASLLEVGTGFHPELTGRENIFLNGAILGMSRVEIKRKFDEIVAFAEVEKFLDTPVKRYSSGMYMRLAFAVAAHLEPEILIVDEVLAVGDAQFQKKCLGKMEEVSSAGRTVLFVSHNLAAVRALCKKGILLKNGRVELCGAVAAVADAYALATNPPEEMSHTVAFPKPAGGRLSVWIESATVLCNGEPGATIQMGDRLGLAVRFRASKPVDQPILGLLIRSAQGVSAINANNYYQRSPTYPQPVMEGLICCDFGRVPLMADGYSISLWLCRDPQEQQHVEEAVRFQVEERDLWGQGRTPPSGISCMWWNTQFDFK
jgi:lipopolysaccharide transport system ATP-binding protein